MRWHISHLFSRHFPSPLVRESLAGTGRRQSPGRGCWEEFQGLLGFGWDTLRPLLALPHTPTALGPALVLPKHDCPSSGKRKWAHDGVKQVENTFHSPRDISALSATPLLGDHSAQGCRGAQSPCTGWEKGLQTFPGGCWVSGWLSWPVGCQEEEQNRAGTAVHRETGGQYTTFSHCLCSNDSICPYQLITSANEPGVFNLPFISPQVGAH